MDKNWKLSRYDRKDYTELVDFPVEIVGRDGVVRRYTFEDSIRLYQKRITSAATRYRDADLARAEINHCQSRIDQLRRSFFHRYGWGTPEGSPAAEEAFGDLAGELAAFLCRVLSVEDRPDIVFFPVSTGSPGAAGSGGAAIWYVVPQHLPRVESGMILYFHRFDPLEAAESGPRSAFVRHLRELERSARVGGDAERLVAFHHTADCGFVLTGRASDYTELGQGRDEVSGQPVDLASTPWDEVLEIVRKGDYEAALRRCKDLVREQPWHRNAYVAGSMIASYLGEYGQGEDLANIGSRYFPKDGALHYYLGTCLLRQGRTTEGEAALHRAVEAAPDLAAARAMLVVHYLQDGRTSPAWELLEARRRVVPDERRVEAELALLEQWLRWRRWTTVAGALLGLVGLSSVSVLGGAGFLLVAPGIAVGVLGWMAFRHEVNVIQNRQRFEEISQGLRRLHRRSRTAVPVS
jgi:tetratricopeptide (TPR) repeat protein